MCIGWYPCGLKYCKGKPVGGGDSAQTTTYRCGIKTCRKCSQFTYYVRQKQHCLWDEWRGVNGRWRTMTRMMILPHNYTHPFLCPIMYKCKTPMTIIVEMTRPKMSSCIAIEEVSSISSPANMWLPIIPNIVSWQRWWWWWWWKPEGHVLIMNVLAIKNVLHLHHCPIISISICKYCKWFYLARGIFSHKKQNKKQNKRKIVNDEYYSVAIYILHSLYIYIYISKYIYNIYIQRMNWMDEGLEGGVWCVIR